MTFPFSKPPAGTQLNPLHPLSKGLVLCQLFNEGAGSLANDISGNKNHGRLKNMAPNVQGSGWGGSKFGGSLKFDGVDDYVNAGNNASLDITVATVSMWFNANVTGDSLMGRGFDKWRMYGNPMHIYNNRDGAYSSWTTNWSYSINIWYHLVWVNSGSNEYLYINGELKDSRAVSGVLSSTTDLILGAYSTTGDFFNGSIDEVRVYNRALSAEEVRLSYEQPFCMMMKPRITTLLKMLGSLDKNNQFLLDSLNCKVMQLGNTRINTWNTLGRPTAKRGMIGFNTTTNKIEVYDGSAWKSVSLS